MITTGQLRKAWPLDLLFMAVCDQGFYHKHKLGARVYFYLFFHHKHELKAHQIKVFRMEKKEENKLCLEQFA